MFSSIRWQIQLWHGLLLTVIVATLMIGFYRYQRTVELQNLDRDLASPLVSLLPKHIPLPGMDRPPGPEPGSPPDLEQKLEERGYYVGFWSPEGEVTYLSPHHPRDIPLPPHRDREPVSFGRWNGPNYEFIHITPKGDIALIGIPGAVVEHRLLMFGLVVTAIGLAVVAVGLLGGWWVAGRITRPIAVIAATAESIAAGQHDQRISVTGGQDELSRLATVLNATFDRLAQVYDQQVRFTADASHELRTPVSVILAQSQMALSRDREAKAYRDALEICQRSAQRMKALLGDLIDLSRYDALEPGLRMRECDLAEVVRESLEFISPLATERQVKVLPDIDSIVARVDPINLSHAFINLLTNAIKHNPEGCEIKVTLKPARKGIQFVVTDSGQGIPAEAIPHLFDRFYRVDLSRARATGGSGLGLSIAKAIAEAHGGGIEVSSTLNTGTTFTLSLP